MKRRKIRKLRVAVFLVFVCLVVVACIKGFNYFFTENNYWQTKLINVENKLDDSYKVELLELENGQKVDARIYTSLKEMFDKAYEEHVYMEVVSGYRTREEQEKIYNDEVQRYISLGYNQKDA